MKESRRTKSPSFTVVILTLLGSVASKFVMASHPIAGDDGARQGCLARKYHACADFGELVGLALAIAVEHLETFPLRGKSGAAAIGGHDQRCERDRPVKVAVVQQLVVDDAGMRFRDICHVLASRDEHRGETVRGMRTIVG